MTVWGSVASSAATRAEHKEAVSRAASAAPFIAPALAILCVMNVLPLLWSIGASFFHFRADHLTKPPRFLALGDYVDLMTDFERLGAFPQHRREIAASVATQLVVGGLLAFVFFRAFPGRRAALMLVLTPMLLSTVAVGTFFSLFYDPTFGIVSAIVRPLTENPLRRSARRPLRD